tara:strand:- start:264 stop:506 length:243 start_codon:yes stop_codon:yes gene_type:complete
MTRIIYKQDNGRVAIIHPCTWETNPATGKNFTVEEVAVMIVPNGKKYKIIEDSDIPTDKTFRNAWTVDDSELTDGTGSAS